MHWCNAFVVYLGNQTIEFILLSMYTCMYVQEWVCCHREREREQVLSVEMKITDYKLNESDISFHNH